LDKQNRKWEDREMPARIGIRVEDKNEWERRTPLIPAHVKQLHDHSDIEVVIQASPRRAFTEVEYLEAGASSAKTLSDCPVIFAIKEIPAKLLEAGKTYIFFSHTIKGQRDNMPMLQRILDLGCQLIDYEKIVDAQGRRIVFFGDYAGMAGMIDTLWALGKRLREEDIRSPFEQIRKAHEYADLAEAKSAIRKVGKQIIRHGLPQAVHPLIIGFAGYGNVSRGAQEVFDLLPVQALYPRNLVEHQRISPNSLGKVVFKEEDMVEPISPGTAFELQDYYDYPDRYRGVFATYIPYLTVLMNGIYWTDRYPRLVTIEYLKSLFAEGDPPRLRVIGDISCDVNGAIECNVGATTPGDPIYVYDPISGGAQLGYQGRGVVVLAVDNLPAQLPRESSTHFSETLLPFVPEIAHADYSASFEDSGLSDKIRRAVIAWRGKLTPDYHYLTRFL
jgi:saccharopine dehydrogenase (NAD+, L-lysine-forming)